MKTSELTDAALDWAVCVAEGCTYTVDVWLYEYKHLEGPRYSTDWKRGGPMIERERICPCPSNTAAGSPWSATDLTGHITQFGPTLLIAAMRCYVASKLGDDIEIPKELL